MRGAWCKIWPELFADLKDVEDDLPSVNQEITKIAWQAGFNEVKADDIEEHAPVDELTKICVCLKRSVSWIPSDAMLKSMRDEKTAASRRLSTRYFNLQPPSQGQNKANTENPLFTPPIRVGSRISFEHLLEVHCDVAVLGFDPNLLPDSYTVIPAHQPQGPTSSTSTSTAPSQIMLATVQPPAAPQQLLVERRVSELHGQQVKYR
ncbi:hypothetical protein PR048_001605 [Dryococelus australis]|uniref:Uncharacterized protein n=1 Tax=Dryococelus australis TaxID=614101 RepID=A0ABQ9IHZ5_9NEOP|nr:hypothetical protein PR048_001605 [Dryococelus australis]